MIEAEQRHVRDSLDLELEQANHAATPCNVDKNEHNAGSDGCKEKNQCEQGQRQTKHDSDDAGDGDDKNGVQMTNDERDDTNVSQAHTGRDMTKYRALVARISDLSQDRPDLKFAAMQVCCAMAKPPVRDMERVDRIGRYLVGSLEQECLIHWQQSGEFEAYSDADWSGHKVTRRSVSAGSDHERLTLFERMEQEAAGGIPVHCRVRGIGNSERGEGLGHCMWVVNLHLDATPTMCLVNRRGLGKAKQLVKKSWAFVNS